MRTTRKHVDLEVLFLFIFVYLTNKNLPSMACKKRKFRNSDTAMVALLHLWKRPGRRECRYYKCGCGKYHLTSKP